MWDLIPIGLVITLEPLPLITFIAVLSTERGTRNGLAYIAGWAISLVLVILATLAFTGGHPVRAHSNPGRGVSWAVVGVGALLIGVAVRKRRRMSTRPHTPKAPPQWMSKFDAMSPWSAAGLGCLVQPWPFVAAGAASIAQSDISKIESVVYLVLFCVLSTASILVMEGYAVFAHESAIGSMTALREWLNRHRDKAIFVLALVGGIALVSKGTLQLLR